jgi:cytochrome c biogenesis protein
LALQGFFLPTAEVDAERGPYSSFPGPDNPAVFLSAWSGDLALDRVPNVYQLDTSGMTQLGIKSLVPGQSWPLQDTGHTVTFDGFVEFASFSVARDPGKELALVSSLLAILGLTLSLMVQRRRLWVRVRPGQQGVTVVDVAGLTRSEHGSVAGEVEAMVSALPGPTGDAPEGSA